MKEKIVLFFKPIISFILSVVFTVSPIVTGFFTGCRIYPEVKYGEDENQVLDLYIPQKLKGDAGIIIYIHGGWENGDKSSYNDDAYHMTQKEGISTAALNFRHADVNAGIDIFDNMDDVTAALIKIKEVGAERDINFTKAIFIGTSAGGQLALMYAYTMCDKAPIKPVAAVDYCGIVDLTDRDMIYNSGINEPSVMAFVFCRQSGCYPIPETYEEALPAFAKASPTEYVNENTVPTLICHGALDTDVLPSQSERLVSKLEQYGVEYEYLIYPNSEHLLKSDPDCTEKANKKILEYANRFFK